MNKIERDLRVNLLKAVLDDDITRAKQLTGKLKETIVIFKQGNIWWTSLKPDEMCTMSSYEKEVRRLSKKYNITNVEFKNYKK